MSEVSGLNIERVISIRGSVEGMAGAEAMISSKLRTSYENDLQVSTSCTRILSSWFLEGFA